LKLNAAGRVTDHGTGIRSLLYGIFNNSFNILLSFVRACVGPTCFSPCSVLDGLEGISLFYLLFFAILESKGAKSREPRAGKKSAEAFQFTLRLLVQTCGIVGVTLVITTSCFIF
jgi:hypothetical protein